VQIDAVQQGSADLSEVPLDDTAGAAALAGRIREVAARTPVQIAM
jgi:hypothetical protein